MVMALAGEVSVLYDRLDTHERLAETGTPATPASIDAFELTEDIEKVRDQRRSEYLARVLRIVTEELERLKRDEAEKA